MTTMMWVWLGVMVISLLAELCTMELISIWFTFGAIIPFVLEVSLGLAIEWQLTIFIVLSAVLLASLRKIAKKFFLRNSEGKTNLENIIGQKYKLIEPITESSNGTIKINGVVWTATTENGQEKQAGELVEIIKISGNKIIVK